VVLAPGDDRRAVRTATLGSRARSSRPPLEEMMIILGVLLLLLGLLLKISILWTIGIILVIVGLVLLLLGSTGRAVGGRRHFF
jgi:uncharacterized membrane protein HdeD (DUF308 family)